MFDWVTDQVYESYSHWGFIPLSAAVYNEVMDKRISAFIEEHERQHKIAAKVHSWNVAADMTINDMLLNRGVMPYSEQDFTEVSTDEIYKKFLKY